MGWVKEYFDSYSTIAVSIPGDLTKTPAVSDGFDDVVQVSVTDYQNTGSTSGTATKEPSEVNIGHAQSAYRDYRKSGSQWIQLPRLFDAVAIRNAHTGKGASEDIRATLELLVWSECQKPVEARKRITLNDWRTYLPAYVKKNMGLDCLGFVANAVRDRYKLSWSAEQVSNTDMWYFMTDKRKVVQNQRDISSGHVLIWVNAERPLQDTRHIALIDDVVASSGQSPWVTAKMAESHGSCGLNYQDVRLQASGKKGKYGPVFTINRVDSQHGDPANRLVYVVDFQVRTGP